MVAAALGPAAAIALADNGGGGLPGSSTTVVSTPATVTVGAPSTTTGTSVTVTTPCSGSVGTATTTTGPAATTTVATTATITTVETTATTTTTTTTTGTTTGTTTTTTPVTTPVTTTVPTTATVTTPGTTTVTVTPPCTTTAPAPNTIAVPKSNPFKGRAMWIWQLAHSDGGNIAAIISQAKRYRIRALYVKSSDGTGYWPQFSRALVTDLHEAGIKVCAWQYVYGVHPVTEANLGVRALRNGADCLVIDAESEYQGRYAAAQTYIAQLRKLIGPRFPVGLAGFPYVGYHLTFPYSVFLGPNGAQYNLPQMYWADIGTSVPSVFAITYEYNEIYRRPIFPLGQLWNSGSGMSVSTIEQFNLLAQEYRATGVSWWDWQSAPLSYWGAITRTGPLPVSYSVNRTPASIFRGNKGDLVIWAQEHLYGAGYRVVVDGQFGPRTQAAVRAFQRRNNLAPSGVINGLTWDYLVRATPVNLRWTHRSNQTVAVIARKGRVAGRVGAVTLVQSVPAWMRRVHSRNELHGDFGAGTPSAPATARR